MTLSEIYLWIRREFPYFNREDAGQGWKNSIRHNLSVNRMFEKQARSDGDSANKGSYWLLNEDAAKDGCAISRRKRNRSRRKDKASPLPARRAAPSPSPGPEPAGARRRGPGPIALSFDDEPPSAAALLVSEPSPWTVGPPPAALGGAPASPPWSDDPRSPLMSAMIDGYARTLAMASTGFHKCASQAGLEDFSDVIWWEPTPAGSDGPTVAAGGAGLLEGHPHDQVVPADALRHWGVEAEEEPTTPGLIAVFPPLVPV